MAVYEYLVKDINGKYTKGEIRAVDEETAWKELRSLGAYPVKLKEVRGRVRKHPIGMGRLALFSEELSASLHSGIPLAQAINMMGARETKPDLKGVYETLYHMLLNGMNLSDAMELQGGIFPPFIISMFRAGEAGGNLAGTAAEMACYYEKEDQMHKKITTAMTYPAFLFLTMAAALLILFTKVLPEFFDLFYEMETLPESTRAFMKISEWLDGHLTEAFAAVGAGIVFLSWLFSLQRINAVKDRMMMHIPFAGKLICTLLTARFARTFGALYAGGVPVVKALELTCEVLGNAYLKSRFHQVTEDVSNGVLLSGALSQIEEFNRELIGGIYVGEETGKLDSMLGDIADAFDSRAEHAAGRLLTLIEPAMIVLMAVIIGFIMVSVMVPIYQYYQSVG